MAINITGLGNANGIGFKSKVSGGGSGYLPPELKDSIVGLWKSDQNTNESPTRNIIKNTIKDKGGDLELLNFGYKLNSGYGKYIEDFSLFTLSNRFEYSEISNTKVTITAVLDNSTGIYHSVTEEDSALYWNTFKIKVSGSTDDVYISYVTNSKNIRLYNGINTVVVPNDLSWHSFTASATNVSCNITLEFVPEYEGALVTDGKDDMIVSQKTVQEMLGGSNVCTVVSMIHTISSTNTSYEAAYTNCIIDIDSPNNIIRNNVGAIGKTGIYGYKCFNLNTQTTNTSIINNILGDKNDYGISAMGAFSSTSKFSVIGFGNGTGLSEVAVYWTFISNKVLTTDEINQIIGYFKLDKYVTPQVIYDVKRQGLTNDTPAADWYLKDFSGNGYDMQLYNYAKSKDSGIGKYELDFNEFNFAVSNPENTLFIKTSSYLSLTKRGDVETASRVYTMKDAGSTQYPSYKVRIEGLQNGDLVRYWYVDENSKIVSKQISENGEHTIPKSYQSSSDSNLYYSFDIISINIGTITVTQIPDYEGALVSDGKDDYGQFVGDLGLKDYTIAVDRAYVEGLGAQVPIISSIGTTVNTPFLMEHMGVEKILAPHSFGTYTALSTLNTDRFISYQSTYKYNGDNLTKGTSTDTGSGLTIGRFGANNSQYAKLALWSLLLFPYTLSEFLLERQLKRYKLGTLYPDMVEFRPIVKSNSEYQVIDYYIDNLSAVVGKYYPIDSNLRIAVVTKGVVDEVSSLIINGVSFGTPNVVNNRFTFNGTLSSKSPQKIDITIDEYIRYEDIVQPYPAIINLKQDGKTITWGDKLKVGSDIVFAGSANLLPELYTVSETRYNGVTLYPNTIIKVEKSMVFDNARIYLKANEPNCILSPNRLRIPNSSYKILGYIPDLTGKGNHGRLNNFAYAGMSGANGYVEDFTKWSKNSSLDDVEITYDRIKVNKLTGSTVLYVTSNKFINKIKIVASGIPNGGKLTFTQYPDNAIENNKEFEIGGVTTTGSWNFSIKEGLNLDWSNLVIQQIGEHEGSICFDGTDDHITIPTLAHGGKCVMMKVNWSNGGMLYDQRLNSGVYTFGILTGEATLAYNARNNGSTYIDGILNANIIPSDLVGITHNITAVNDAAIDNNTVSPRLGISVSNVTFSNQALYEFMLFPEIPSEDEIKKLNNVMGIEGGYVESPNYYWDSFGKSNNNKEDIDYDNLRQGTDANRQLIDKSVLGLKAIEDYIKTGNGSDIVSRRLYLNNVAYNSESGYTDDNGLLLDGVEDHAVNTAIPAFTDFTVIAKRTILDTPVNSAFCCKGEDYYTRAAFMLEFRNGSNEQVASFGTLASGVNLPDLITFMTATSYNGRVIGKGTIEDTVGLWVGRYNAATFWKGVFYKAMLYSKTIDMLSINMLKNLFAKDELIDVNNPIFKKQ